MTDEGAKALVNLFQEQEKKEREKRLIIGVRLPETIESALQNLIANLKRGQSDPRALGLL